MSYHTSTSYFVAIEKTHSVEVKAWTYSDTEWAWNVYAHVFEDHPLYGDKDALMDAPLHGGCTFDREKVEQPIGGPKYDFERITKSMVIGSDYRHLGSPDYSSHAPELGIPWMVEKDAIELAEWLKNKS